MTEVASLLPSNHRLTSVRHYEAGPPEGLDLVEPGETFATTKEEEWVSKKKTEVTNTKQIETRVKRQVVLEDGKVVEDTGPLVTTNTKEDTETQEHHQTELRKLGDGEDVVDALEGPSGEPKDLALNNNNNNSAAKWIPTANPDGVVRDVKEKRVISREETEEVKETEDVQHYGDITDEDFLSAVNSGRKDIRQVLRTRQDGDFVVSTGPRLVRDTTKSNKVTDTEDTRHLSSVLPGGKIVTETRRTTEHEEVKDDELPEGEPDRDYHKENTQRYRKTRDQEDVDYVADGVNIGHEMRFRTETLEVERHGDAADEPDFDSLSARMRRRGASRQPHRYRGVENQVASPLDRKDALTRKPLDFDQEEETRKVETSKWLEHHFGSDSRSSNNSVIDEEDEEPREQQQQQQSREPPKTSFFNVTIKSQPVTPAHHGHPQKSYVSPISSPRVYTPSPVEPERERVTASHSEYYKGISQWSDRRDFVTPSPPYRQPVPEKLTHRLDYDSYNNINNSNSSSVLREKRVSPLPDYNKRASPIPDYVRDTPSPLPPTATMMMMRDGGGTTPTPPLRKRTSERRHHQVVEERERERIIGARYNKVSSNGRAAKPVEEPPPDYSPPEPVPAVVMMDRSKPVQKTRFAPDPPKVKSGNIIGQSIRKLVGKIRSASAERKARQRAKRSPSPSYQKGHVIDSNIGNHHHGMENGGGNSRHHQQPVQRYYLGEDPFAGSIYGRENKYDGVRPARSSRKREEEQSDRRPPYMSSSDGMNPGTASSIRSQSTLGRFSKSTGRLGPLERNSQTLPRHLSRQNDPPTRLERNNRSNSTINVSIINTLARPSPTSSGVNQQGPAKPARTYRSNLARSKSLNVHAAEDYRRPGMYTSNPQLNRLEENPVGLKSPGLISSLSRSQKDLHESDSGRYTSRFARNGSADPPTDLHNYTTTPSKPTSKRIFMKGLEERAPELFKTLHEDEEFQSKVRANRNKYNGDIYEPPTRLRDSPTVTATTPVQSILRRGSNSSTDFSETYHTTTRNDDPLRPSVTNTVKSFSKKTIPGRDGRGMETIESSETKSVTKSQYKREQQGRDREREANNSNVKFYETERRYSAGSPVVIEVRNTNYRK